MKVILMNVSFLSFICLWLFFFDTIFLYCSGKKEEKKGVCANSPTSEGKRNRKKQCLPGRDGYSNDITIAYASTPFTNYISNGPFKGLLHLILFASLLGGLFFLFSSLSCSIFILFFSFVSISIMHGLKVLEFGFRFRGVSCVI